MSETVERITQMTSPPKQFQKYTGKNIRGTYALGQKIGYNIDHESTLKLSRDRKNRMRFVRTREIENIPPKAETLNGQKSIGRHIRNLKNERNGKIPRLSNRNPF